MADFKVGRRELYILPTRVGWYFALILIALFAIAVKFDNQGAFMMLFIFASIGMVNMLYTHNNTIGLSLSAKPPRSIFAGESVSFPVSIHNQSNKKRHAVWLICEGSQHLLDLDANSEKQIELNLPSVKRGYLNCPPICLTSQYPLGLFFCWTKQFKPAKRCLVYPQPLELVELPMSDVNVSQKQLQSKISKGAEDYSGMKPYQAGDRLRDVHWPSYAKTQKLVTITHQEQTSDTLNLSWFALPQGMNTEDKLSQLCAWVVMAEQNQLRYQLEMPNHTISYDNGRRHFHKCLRVLALWEIEDG